MGAFALIRTNGSFPPGGFTFTDAITGKTYAGTHRTFENLKQEIKRDRLANHRLFVDERFVDDAHIGKEVSIQICQRLNNNKRYCSNGLPAVIQSVAPQAAPVAVVGKTCKFCGGTSLTAVLCQTCARTKILSYRCTSCGKDNPK